MRTRATVAGLTSSAAPMAASVQPGPASPWLAFNRTRAWVSALAGATPCPIMVCSRARSSSDRTTMCRLRTSASCDGDSLDRTSMRPNLHTSQVTTDELLVCVHDPEHRVVVGDGPDLRNRGIRVQPEVGGGLLGGCLGAAALAAATQI